MRVLIVNPHGLRQGPCFDMPTNLLYLIAALREAGVECKLADGNLIGEKGIQDIILSWHPTIVGISCLSPVRFAALDIARFAWEQGCSTVMGGHHPNWMWRQVMEHYPFVDAIVFGEGDMTIVDLALSPWETVQGIVYRDEDKIVRTHARRYVEDLDALPFPAWDVIDFQHYRQSGAIGPRVYYSRGCLGRCKFCNSTKFWRGYRHRSPANFCDELEWLYRLGESACLFGDDNATGQDATALFEEMERRRGKIAAPVSVTTRVDAVDDNLCQLMARVGVSEVCLGVESGSQRMLDHMRKGTTVEQNTKAMLAVKKAGMKATALMIKNSIGETAQDRELTRQWIEQVQPDAIGSVDALWLYPATVYYDEVRAGVYDGEICQGKELVDDAFFLNERYAQHVISWKNGSIFPFRVTHV